MHFLNQYLYDMYLRRVIVSLYIFFTFYLVWSYMLQPSLLIEDMKQTEVK